MNFTLLALHLFNSFPTLVMISTGLHNNMKMSQKLLQNGNPEAGSHKALSEFCVTRSSAWSCVFNPSAHSRPRTLQRSWDSQSPFPAHFAISKKQTLNMLLSEISWKHAHSQMLCVVLLPKKECISFQTMGACNPDCQRRAYLHTSVKTSNCIRPGPQLMQSDRAPRNLGRYDDAD